MNPYRARALFAEGENSPVSRHRNQVRLVSAAKATPPTMAASEATVAALQASVAALQRQQAGLQEAVDTFWLLFAGALVFFMQCGFGMLEAGAVKSKSTQNIHNTRGDIFTESDYRAKPPSPTATHR